METVRQLGNLLNEEQIKDLSREGFLGLRYFQKDYIDKVCQAEIGPKLSHITEKARTEIWIKPVIEKIKFYLCPILNFSILEEESSSQIEKKVG